MARTLLLVELASTLMRMPFVAARVQYERELAGVSWDPSDVLYLLVVVALALRPADADGEDTRLPGLRLWIGFGVLRTLAYLTSPVSGVHIGDPIAAVWQFYRYCWKPLLLYPLGWRLLRDPTDRARAVVVLVATALLTALLGIAQGYAGLDAYGPFRTKNQFGGFLVVPAVLAFARAFGGPRVRFGWAAAFGVLVRALVFTSSRGACVSTLFGIGIVTTALVFAPATRARALRVIGTAVAGGLLLFAMRPGLLERENVQVLLAAARPLEDGNVQFRLERWTYVWTVVREHPLLGIGDDVDPALGATTNTPHNGYLSMAVISGIPSVLLFLALMGLALRRAARTARHAEDERDRAFALAVLAALAATLLHNLNDSTMEVIPVGRMLWLLAAWGMAAPGPVTARVAASPDPDVPARADRLGAAYA